MSHIFADHMVVFGVQFRYLEQGVISLFFESSFSFNIRNRDVIAGINKVVLMQIFLPGF